MKQSLVGKRVIITNKDSWFYGEWGTVEFFDGDYYHVSIANGQDIFPIFDKKEFKLMKEEKNHASH